MPDTKLIIVEGLPASGKSTTGEIISSALRKAGKNVICADEGTRNHPADFDNYDFPDFAAERASILDKWKSFTANIANDTVYVFNCLLLQNPMCETMMRFAMTEEQSLHYICEIADIIRPLAPLVIYLKMQNVRAAIERVLPERGNDWLNAVIAYHVDQGYGKAHRLHGFGGYISCLIERQARELRILERTGLRHAIFDKHITEKEFMELFE